MEHLLWSFEVESFDGHGERIPLWVEISSPSVQRTWRWVERLLQDPDFLRDLLEQLEERPLVIHHRNVDSSLPHPQGEDDHSKTYVTISSRPF